jgi:hypothetical protein
MSENERTAEVLVREALEPANFDRLKADPVSLLNELKREILNRPRVLEHDRFVYRTVISSLSLLALAVAGAAIYLAIVNNGKVDHFPEILTALGSASLGALAGIIAPNQK